MKVFVRKITFFILILITTNLFLANKSFAQRFAVASGNWNGPIWATTVGGVAGSAATPTAANAVTINPGISVAMNVAGNCLTLALTNGALSASVITGTNLLTIAGNMTVTSTGTGTNGAVISCPLALGAANRTFTVANDGTSAIDLTISGIISGGVNIGFAKAGAGTLFLLGSSTYTGTTTISAGTIQLGATGDATNTPLGTIDGATSITAGAALDLNGFTLGTAEPLTLRGTGVAAAGALLNSSSTSADYSGVITMGAAGSIIANAGDINITGVTDIIGNTFRLTLGGTGNGSITRNINNTTGGLTKSGTGTWTVSGNSTYTGTTLITGGLFKLASAGDGTNTPLGTITGRTTVSTGAVLDLSGLTLSTAEPLTVNGTGISNSGVLVNSSATSVDYSGLMLLGSASSIITNTGAINLTNAGTMTGATFGLTLGGSVGGSIASIIGTGSGTLTKTGTGTWTLSGTNTFVGATTISAGTLKLGGTGTNISNSSAVTVTGILDLAGGSETIGSLAGTGTVTSSVAGSIILTAGGNNTSTTFSGIIQDGSATSVGFTKGGSGTLNLSGNNTFTGNVIVSRGVLQLGAAGDGTNTPLGTTGGSTTVNNGTSLDLNGFPLSTNESLTLYGTGITSGGALSNSSATAVSYGGTITLAASSSIIANAGDINIINNTGITGTGFILTIGGTGNGSLERNINVGAGRLTKIGTGTWTVSGNSSYNGITTISAGVLQLGAEGDGVNSPLGIIAGRTSITAGAALELNGFTLSTAELLTLNGTGISATGALINSSISPVDFTGAITLGSAGSIATIGDISLTTNAIGGLFDLTKVGTGSLNFGTGNSAIRGLIISDGTVSSSINLLSLTGDLINNSNFNNSNGTVRFNGTVAQVIGGTVPTVFNRVTLTNAAGVSLSAIDATINGVLTLTSGSFGIGANTLNFNGTITGAGTLTGSINSNLIIGGAGGLGTLNFNQTTDLVTNALANLTINRTPGGTVTLGNTLNVLSAVTFTAGVLNVNGRILRLGGAVSRTTGTITNTNAAGVVVFNGSSSQSIPTGLFTANAASNITISNSAGVTASSSLAISGSFQINANSYFRPAAAVVISGAGTLVGIDPNNSIAQVTRSTGVSDLTGQYTLNRNLASLIIEYAGTATQGIAAATTFGGLKITNLSNVSIAGNVSVNGRMILNSGNLVIGGNTLTLNGAVSRTSGNFTGSNTSNLTIGGTAGSLFFDGTGTNNFLRNFIINTGASATLGNALNITGGASAANEGTLTVTGTGVLTTGGLLTIKSNSNGTGRIAPGNTAGGYISGDVTVERFIPQNASKAWRLLSSNTSGQTINAAWQEGQIGPLSNTNPGFGTMIPGLFSTLAQAQAAGFDTLSQAPSITKYDVSTDNLLAVPNTNSTQLSSQQGYFIYIRGDRSPNQFGNGTVAATSTTLRSKGSVFQGDQSTATVQDGQYALLRNPFASAIDLRNVTIGGSLVDAYEVWDPQLAGSFGLGGYQTLTRSGANYIVTPGGGSYPASGNIVNTIESGAAFFVQATGGAGTLQVTESSKTSGSNLRFRPSGTLAENSRLITNLYVVNGSTTILADGNLILFDAANNNGFDKNDVKKGVNFGENFGIAKKGTDNLVVERRSLSSGGDTVFFSMSRLKQLNYQLEINPSNINDPLLTGFLEDKYKATLTPVSLSAVTNYNFTVDANAASSAADRFRIVFRSAGALPVTFTSIKAAQINKNVAVEWKVANQLNIAGYEVEKSINGRSFNKVASQIASQVNAGNITYSWLDENAVTGVNYYRIKAIEISGTAKYTEIVKVVLGKNGTGITVSPNPVRGNLVNIQFNNQQSGRYSIRLVNNAGQEIYKNVLQHAGGSASQSINIPSAVTRGIYQLQVIAPDNSKQVQKLIIDINN